MRKVLLGFVLLLMVSLAAYLRFHHSRRPREVAYAGSREVTLYSTTAEVRAPVATVSFGERLDVLDRSQDQVKVRSKGGVAGWVNQQELLSADLWQKAKDLDARAATSPIEARGHTRVLSNMHTDPGRDAPRIRQLNKDVPMDLFERRPVEAPLAAPSGADEEGVAGEAAEVRKEDWWLVRAHLPDQSSLAGWILGRFITLDVPSPLPDYASSAGMRIVAWFELNRIADASGNPKPQYLVAGARGPEGQPCDFTLMRVYTWSVQRKRYETAFVKSDVCGKLPVKLAQPAPPGGDLTFAFEDLSKGAPRVRTYRMHQTVVRAMKEDGGEHPAQRHAR